MSPWRSLSTGAAGGLAALCLSLLTPAPAAHAGVVVLKNGEVLVGRIRDEEDTQEQLIMRWPYKEHVERGEMVLPKFRIRWYDREADQPTDAYWEKYENDPIDAKWLPLLEKWRVRKKAEQEAMGEILVIGDPLGSDRGLRLSPIPHQTQFFTIQYPDGWTRSVDEDGITIFLSEKPGVDGFTPRIHVFSVRSAIGVTEDQVQWITDEVSKLADGGFEVREKKRLRPWASGFDQELLTRTVRRERPVLALRKVFFRSNQTYFFTAYAHERDYTGLELLFKACMRSLEIFEDKKAEEDRKKKIGAPAEAEPDDGE